ncbi:MAG: CDP-alcohol phosphatidyltransferase family protein [Chloroflexota bacterium]|nr:CDP-alcohol phosphatidyltransferase family protein [Chloroflexota bacterium]
MANLITVARLVLLFFIIWLIYVGNVPVLTACMVMIALIFASDGLDGWVARKRNSTTSFGAVFDIMGDRIVENALWVIFADLDLIPVWIPLLVLTRGFIVDGLRSLSYSDGMTPFGDNNMMRSAFTEWLTAGRFMRGFFGWAKAAGFVFLTGLAGHERLNTDDTVLGELYAFDWYVWCGWALVWSAVALTVVRGIPVMIDAVGYFKETNGNPTSSR